MIDFTKYYHLIGCQVTRLCAKAKTPSVRLDISGNTFQPYICPALDGIFGDQLLQLLSYDTGRFFFLIQVLP